MEIHKFKLTQLAIALGLTATLAACSSDNDKTPPPVEPTPTQKVVELPAGTTSEKQAGFFTVVVKDSEGNSLGSADVPITVKITKNSANVVSTKGEALTADDLTITNGAGLFAASLSELTAETSITVNFTAPGYFNNSKVITLSVDDSEVAETVTLVSRSIDADNVAIVSEEKSVNDLAENGATVTFKEDGSLETSDGSALKLAKTVTKTNGSATSDKGGVQISIPSGSKMLAKNEAGELVPLTSAPSLAVAYFNNEASSSAAANDNNESRPESALDYFPGGLDLAVSVPTADNVTTEVTTTGSFTTAGFVAIELTDDAGNKVKEFGSTGDGDNATKNSIEVKMQVEVKTSNACPMTYADLDNLDQATVAAFAVDASKSTDSAYFRKGACVSSDGSAIATRPIKAGDIIPVWSYDADEAQWAFESYGVAQVNADNADVFDVAVQVTHLSYWNLDFFNWREPNFGQCGDDRKVQFDIKYADGSTDNVTAFDLLVESQSGGYRKLKRGYEFRYYNKSTIANPPSFSVFMSLLNNGTNIIDGIEGDANNPVDASASRLKLNDICELDGKKLVLTLDTAPARVDQKIKTQYACSNNAEGDVEAPPAATSTYAYLIDSSNNYVTYSYTANDGTATFSNVVEGNYKVRVWDQVSRTYVTSPDFAASATNEVVIDLPIECTITEKPVTGTGTTGGS
ncbi:MULTISPECIES: hypothetical protein [Pseudoalteromonas]|uniref:Big-1 domain-containing protein n=1 Tax=Pseudoalteromonas porphyrae TaxID=187330 RepID=A0A0N0M0M5_9GAMM|nr:hypothetical protein [Pseudoalteromonas porphyrae]KPH64238.1 hypothetical protein ADS77_06000 [Pseudoalteromonas porphyrae]